MDPGPSDPSLLQLQSTHISTRTWRGEVYETMRVRRRRGVVDRTMQYHSRMIPYLRSSGFYGISRVAFFSLDWALITAFVERWRPETHTFHMHCGECTITLQDVQVQLGLPIEGMPVTGTTDADYANVCERLLGRTPGGDDVVGCKLKVDWLERNVPPIDDESDEESVQRYVRSYILQLIGGCLFADKSNRFVHLMFLPLLEDFQVAGQYSWGSACLAYLYRELCRGSRAGAHEVAGASILVQLWAWDRFPFIAPRRLHVSRAQQRTVDDQNMLMDVPLGHRWLDAFSISQSATHVVSNYRDALDSQSHKDDVVWQPYTELLGSLPDYCTNGHGSWLSTCPLICFHIVEWHRPERVMRQFGMVQVVPPNCVYDAQLHRLELRGHHHENWVTFHASYIHMWENHGDTIATAALNEGHDHQDYMTWYRSVTRRFIGHDGALRDYMRNLVHRLRRVFIEDGYEQGLAALDEGIKILDEDERQRSNLSHDGIDVEQDIDEDNEQEDEEEDQGVTARTS